MSADPTYRNPFRFGPLALDEAFTDRADELRELSADIRNGQDVVIVAPRRYGKSSLLWRVAQDLVREGVLVAQVDLLRAPTKERLAEKLAKAIHDEIATPLLRARERLKVFGALRLVPVATVTPEGSFSFSFAGRSSEPDLDATLEALLALPARLGAERRRRVALVLDEFQEVIAIDPGLIKLMRSVFQEQPEVAHVYLGSRRHMMSRIFNDENEPFWRSAKQLELGPIDPGLFTDYATARFTQTGKALGYAAGSGALAITGGHPYATQELLYFLWEATTPGVPAGEAELERALEATLRSEHTHFSLLWERAAAAQRMVLQALAAEGPGRPLTSGYQERHGLPSTATVQTALAALVRAEHVRREGRGAYAIAEPFLAQWIARYES
ncbi:MAG TPA: ATP-binding protein [Solirubrobacteraceae bacterium]|jgi:hypothetical protein|nr:ATP-binding protein [Solirubrobacteraceae bacterium]